VTLAAGSQTIQVMARDQAGNSRTAQVQVNVVVEAVDSRPPVVTIVRPKNGAWVAQSQITLEATIADQSAIQAIQLKWRAVNLAQLSAQALATSVTLTGGSE
jgi:hypothetical protein